MCIYIYRTWTYNSYHLAHSLCIYNIITNRIYIYIYTYIYTYIHIYISIYTTHIEPGFIAARICGMGSCQWENSAARHSCSALARVCTSRVRGAYTHEEVTSPQTLDVHPHAKTRSLCLCVCGAKCSCVRREWFMCDV